MLYVENRISKYLGVEISIGGHAPGHSNPYPLDRSTYSLEDVLLGIELRENLAL